MKSVELVGVTRRYQRDGRSALEDLTLRVEAAEILVLLGPSGCGKTTTLRLIAGLEAPDSGVIRIGTRVVAGEGVWVAPEKRRVGLVFQDYALFPHLTVLENVLFGLGRLPRKSRKQTALEKLALVGLDDLADRYPEQLSGGQQQRVALARALAPDPDVLLLDEPFSSLDSELRAQMRVEVRNLLKRLRTTTLFVTHDQEEALRMGDRLAVLDHGRLQQLASPQVVFTRPDSRFVATFMGQADFLPAVVTEGGLRTEIGDVVQKVEWSPGTEVEVMVRPDDLTIRPDSESRSRIVDVGYQGMSVLYTVELGSGRRVRCLRNHTCQLPNGLRVRVLLHAEHPLRVFSRVHGRLEIAG